MPVCLWTHETSDRTVPVTLAVPSSTGGEGSPRTVHVLPEHEADLRAYNNRVARWGRPMLVAVLGLTAAVLVVALLGPALGLSERAIATVAGALVVAMGGVIVAFPFSTPQTIEMMGVRRSILLARVGGAVTAAVGAWVAVAG